MDKLERLGQVMCISFLILLVLYILQLWLFDVFLMLSALALVIFYMLCLWVQGLISKKKK